MDSERKWRGEWGKMIKKGRWGTEDCYVVNDQLPIGHGEKSVIILQKFIRLTDEESIAIRWHMAAFDPAIHFNYPSGYPFRESTKTQKLLTLLISADMEASNIIEETNYDPIQRRKG